MVHQFTLFSVHKTAPYLRSCMPSYHAQIKKCKLAVGEGFGWSDFFDVVRKDYTSNYSGPFTIGVCWQDALDADTK